MQKALSEFKRTYCGEKNDYVKNKLEMLPWRTEAFTENKLKIISVYYDNETCHTGSVTTSYRDNTGSKVKLERPRSSDEDAIN